MLDCAPLHLSGAAAAVADALGGVDSEAWPLLRGFAAALEQECEQPSSPLAAVGALSTRQLLRLQRRLAFCSAEEGARAVQVALPRNPPPSLFVTARPSPPSLASNSPLLLSAGDAALAPPSGRRARAPRGAARGAGSGSGRPAGVARGGTARARGGRAAAHRRRGGGGGRVAEPGARAAARPRPSLLVHVHPADTSSSDATRLSIAVLECPWCGASWGRVERSNVDAFSFLFVHRSPHPAHAARENG